MNPPPRPNPAYTTATHEARLDVHKNGPEHRAITLEDIAKIKNALQIGLENSEDLLAQHEISLGRSTRNNRLTAEAMEVDVELILEALAILAP
jgi:hypothetical protein